MRGNTCGAVPLLRRRSRRRIPGIAGWGRHAARRSRASCVAPRPQSWPRAHPSLRLPPSLVVTAWVPAQINFLDIFKTAAAQGPLCPWCVALGAREGSPPRDSVVTVVVGGDRDPGFQSCIVPLPGNKAVRREEQEFLGISLLPTVGFALVCALHIHTPLHCKPPLNLVDSS